MEYPLQLATQLKAEEGPCQPGVSRSAELQTDRHWPVEARRMQPYWEEAHLDKEVASLLAVDSKSVPLAASAKGAGAGEDLQKEVLLVQE